MTLKINLEKVYDRLEWTSIRNVLIIFNFSHHLINWIMTCIEALSFSISIIGQLVSEHFAEEAGLNISWNKTKSFFS